MRSNIEIFKDVPSYDGDYQVSNYGNVKTLKFDKEKLLKPIIDSQGYLKVNLFKDNKAKTYRVHQLIAMAFLGHTPDGHKLVVDHKDNNPLNNHVDNLQLISQRENTSHHKTDCGVNWDKATNKWRARIRIGDKRVHLGLFTDKQEGLDQYQKALENMHLYIKNQILL